MLKVLLPLLMASLTVEYSHQDAVKVVNYEFSRYEGGYNFQYDLSDGQYRSESGWYEGDEKVLHISGQYSYKAPNGKDVDIRYRADKNGFIVIPPSQIYYDAPASEDQEINPGHLKASLLGR